jgi:hypothetical protein
MKLTRQEEDYTREVAQQLGRDPDEMIREGEQLKAEGAAEAQRQARETLAGRYRGAQMIETEAPWGVPVTGIRGLQPERGYEAGS